MLRLPFETLQAVNFCFQFGNGFRGTGLIHDLLDIGLVFGATQLFIQFVDVLRQVDLPRNVVGAEGFGQVLPRFFTTRQ